MTRLRNGAKLLGVLAMTLMVVASMGVGAAETIEEPQQINYDSDAVPNAAIHADVTKDVHKMDWSPTEYEGDDGEPATLNAHVNGSNANPVSLVATDISVSEFSEFPRKSGETENSASAVDANEWTVSGSSMSVSDTTTAPTVDAVSISTSGLTADSSNTATYSNFSIDSDESKRVLQLGVDVTTLDADASVDIRVVDADGDYKNVTIDSSANADDSDVLANATGEGQVTQVKLGSLTTRADSDGDGFDNIEKLEVVVSDGDFSGEFALINAEKLGKYDFGEQAYDGDDDGEKDETRTIQEPNGEYSVTALDTLGDAFSNAEFRNVQYDMIFAASDLEDSMDAKINFSEADGYPSFSHFATIDYRLQLPSAYDLSYSNAELVATTELPDSRYEVAQVAEGVGDTDFEDISSWTDVTSKLSKDTQVTLDSTIQPGQQIVVEFEQLNTDGEKSSMAASGSTGAMGPTGGSSGGIFAWLTTLPGMAVSLITGIVGYRWFKG